MWLGKDDNNIWCIAAEHLTLISTLLMQHTAKYDPAKQITFPNSAFLCFIYSSVTALNMSGL